MSPETTTTTEEQELQESIERHQNVEKMGQAAHDSLLQKSNETSQQVQTALYDKNAPHTATLTKPGEDGIYQLSFTCDSVSDEALKQFDELSISNQKNEGTTVILENDDLAACVWFFKNHVILSGGFDGALPENWQDEFDEQEMQDVVRSLLEQRLYVETEGKAVKKFTFGKAKTGKIIGLIVPIGGVEVLLNHEMPANQNDFLHKFKRIVRVNEQKKGEEGISAPPTWEKLGVLYDEMKIKTTGYAPGGEPLHHKALVLRENFGSNLQKQTKKQIR